MKRIILRHLSGSKANQVEEFPLNHFEELVIGRDPSSTVKFDPDKDDLVGRQHAKIVREGPDSKQFLITDLGSRNGTYVNKERILGTVNIAPGDVVQFGPGGPEFQFDLDPRPEGLARATRIATDPTAATAIKPNAPPATRVSGSDGASNAAFSGSSGFDSSSAGIRPSVGKTTVMRMIAQTKGESKKWIALVAAAVLLIVGTAGAGSLYWVRKRAAEVAAASAVATDAAAATTAQQMSLLGDRASKVEARTSAMTPTEIAEGYTGSTAYVQVSWQLIENSSGNPLFTKYIPNKYRAKVKTVVPVNPNSVKGDGKEPAKEIVKETIKEIPILADGRPYVAAYTVVSTPQGNIVEPYLTTNSNDLVVPVGQSWTGSAFVVTSDGFMITNTHVAAGWRSSYYFSQIALPGVVVNRDGTPMLDAAGQPQIITQLNWIPGDTKQFGISELGRQHVEGRNDSLNVTFPKTQLRIPAKVVRVSDRHDVSMLKIDIPEPLKKVELNDNYDTIKPGDAAVVLGYPGGSPPEVVVIGSRAVRGSQADVQYGIVPNATLSVGNISRMLRGQDYAPGKDVVISSFGDIYQLTINSTGGGNSGGPVFDDQGRVIAVFTYKLGSDFNATAAVPIRYAKELMGVNAVMK